MPPMWLTNMTFRGLTALANSDVVSAKSRKRSWPEADWPRLWTIGTCPDCRAHWTGSAETSHKLPMIPSLKTPKKPPIWASLDPIRSKAYAAYVLEVFACSTPDPEKSRLAWAPWSSRMLANFMLAVFISVSLLYNNHAKHLWNPSTVSKT